MAEDLQQSRARQAQHSFLGQTLAPVADVQPIGDGLCLGVIGREAGVEEVHGHRAPIGARDNATPHPDHDGSTTQRDLDLCIKTLELLAGCPPDGVLDLKPLFDRLAEKSLMVEERDPHQRDGEVRGSLEKVSGQDTQAPAERGYLVVQRDLHGEISDGLFGHPGILPDPSPGRQLRTPAHSRLGPIPRGTNGPTRPRMRSPS